MTVGSLFSGIGGLECGLERAGMEIVWQVEKDEFCRRVLAKHWPDVARYEDVREVHGILAHAMRCRCGQDGKECSQQGATGASDGPFYGGPCCSTCLEPVDLICGGFPCQDISVAGKGVGLEGARSGLWFEFARIVRELRPRYVLVENVPALTSRGLDRVLGDLAEMRYDAEWFCVPAAAFGAPHLRWRIFIVATDSDAERDNHRAAGRQVESTPRNGSADETQGRGRVPLQAGGVRSDVPDTDRDTLRGTKGIGTEREAQAEPRHDGTQGAVADAKLNGSQGVGQGWTAARTTDGPSDGSNRSQWAVEPDVGRVAHGVPDRVDRLRALGNAVVPQVAEWIGRQILAHPGAGL